MAADLCGSGVGSLAGRAPCRGTLTLSPHQPHPLREKGSLQENTGFLCCKQKESKSDFSRTSEVNCAALALKLHVLCVHRSSPLRFPLRDRGKQRNGVSRVKKRESGPGKLNKGPRKREWRQERQSEDKCVPVQTCFCLPVNSHCDSYGRVDSWLLEHWKH